MNKQSKQASTYEGEVERMRQNESYQQYLDRSQKNAQQIVDLSVEQDVTINAFFKSLDMAKEIALQTKLTKG